MVRGTCTASFIAVLCIAALASCAPSAEEEKQGSQLPATRGSTSTTRGAQVGAGDGAASRSSGVRPFVAGATGCDPLKLETDIDLEGYHSDRYAWSDGDCQLRTAALVRNDRADPGGSRGGYMRELTWHRGEEEITATGTGTDRWYGFGYVVNHTASGGYASSWWADGTFRTVFAGRHHAIHEYKLRVTPGGPVDVTIHWVFTTGRSHPIYAISYDASAAGPNVVNADTRAPYGDLAFDGTNGPIGGVGWGDKYRFVTTGTSPVTMASAWDYTATNTVPHVRMWAQTSDAEMGTVQTESLERKRLGGDYGDGLLSSDCWGKTSATKGSACSPAGQSMPQDWLWPFQLNQYELPFTDDSHRVAWGSSFGVVGQTSVDVFGASVSGYPRTSYSVFTVIGSHSAEATPRQVAWVENTLGAELRATEGKVVTSGPAGAGRSDPTDYSPAGYNPVYATWDVEAASSRATMTLTPKHGAIDKPTFRLLGFTSAGVTHATLDGAELLADRDYFASVDAATKTLWLTLNGAASGSVTLHVE